MRTTCKWLQHSAHIIVSAGYSLAQAGGGIQHQLAASYVLEQIGRGALVSCGAVHALPAHLSPSNMPTCCLQTCSLMQTLTGIVLLSR